MDRKEELDELLIANKELISKLQEIERREEELIIANKELIIQSEEAERCAADLVIANKKLKFQIEEKDKHESELAAANKQLAFQNEKKEKHAIEISIANSELIKAKKKITKGNRLYSFISHTNKTIVHVKDEQTLFNDACKIAVHKGKFKMAWIGIANKDEGTIKLVASSTESKEDLSILKDYTYTKEGVIEKTLTSSDYVLIPDLQNELETPWSKLRNERGFKSSICLPIKKSGKTIGVFCLYSSETDFFDREEIDMLIEASNDISFAVTLFEDNKQQRLVQEKLKQSEARLKEAQALGHIGSWEVNLITNTHLWSKELYSIFGINPEGFTPSTESLLSLLYPDDIGHAKERITHSFQTNKPGSFNSRFLKKNFGIKHIYTEWKFEFDKNNKPVRLYGILQDITEAKRSESALRVSESHLQTIFESTSEGFILIDVNGTVKAFNSKTAQIVLLNTEQEIEIGSNLYTFIYPSKKENYKDVLSKVLDGETIKYDHSYERKNGDIKWFDYTLTPVYNIAGEIDGVCITTADITERKEVEQKLQISERFNVGILSSLSSQIAVVNIDGTLVAVNKAWDDFAKANGPVHLSDTSVGSNYFDVCNNPDIPGGEDLKQVKNGILSIFNKEKTSFQLEYPCHSPEEYRWFVMTVSPFGEDDTKVVIAHQNITDRKIAENNLNKSSEELQKTLSELHQILDFSLDVICTTNADGEFVNVSAASKQVWGYTPEELIGTKFKDLVYAEDMDMTNKTAEKLYQSVQIPIFENRYVHKNGKLVPLLWSFNWDDKLQLIFCIAKDVTERKRLEKVTQNERDQFNHMFLRAPSAIGLLKGPTHVFEMANPLYLQLTGKKNVIGKTVAELFPEIIEQGFVSMLDKVYLTGEPFIGKEMLIKIDTEENAEFTDFYINFIYQAYKNTEGDIDGIFFFINDITEQVLAKKKIVKSERLYRKIVETAQEGIWLIDKNSRTTFVNKKMCEILEYTEEELMGRKNLDFMNAIEKEKALVALKRRKKGIAENYELRFIAKDGKDILTNISANPIFDDKGNFKGSLGMVTDITERKHLEDLLGKSNRLARIGSWEIDVVKGTVFWSDITKEIREAEPDFIPDLSTRISFFSEGVSQKTISERVQRCIDNGTPWDEELQLTTFKGNLKWVRTIGEGVFINGKCIKVYGSLQDITERKNAAEEIVRNEEKLNVAQHIAKVGSYEIDMLTRKQSWSDEFYRILAIDKEIKPSGETFLSFVHPDDRTMALSKIETAFSLLKDSAYEFRFKRKDGEIGYASSEWKYEYDYKGNPKTLNGILRDLTEEKKTERERLKMISDIVQRNSDLEQFSYIVSHNLRAPTANIIGFAEILQDETLTPEERKESMQGLSASVKGLDTIIKDINTILQSKREDHEKKEIVIFSKLVKNIKLSVANLIEKHQVSIITDFSEVDEIYSLKIYIYSIFFNLISNSIKYGRPDIPPHIEIKSAKENGKLILTFKDNGLGIDTTTKSDKIFGLYTRFHSHVEGKGMGLFMVKTQVKSLGAKISFESELNKGTKFTIEFEI